MSFQNVEVQLQFVILGVGRNTAGWTTQLPSTSQVFLFFVCDFIGRVQNSLADFMFGMNMSFLFQHHACSALAASPRKLPEMCSPGRCRRHLAQQSVFGSFRATFDICPAMPYLGFLVCGLLWPVQSEGSPCLADGVLEASRVFIQDNSGKDWVPCYPFKHHEKGNFMDVP